MRVPLAFQGGAPCGGPALAPEERRVLERKLKKERKKEERARLREAPRPAAQLALDYLCRCGPVAAGPQKGQRCRDLRRGACGRPGCGDAPALPSSLGSVSQDGRAGTSRWQVTPFHPLARTRAPSGAPRGRPRARQRRACARRERGRSPARNLQAPAGTRPREVTGVRSQGRGREVAPHGVPAEPLLVPPTFQTVFPLPSPGRWAQRSPADARVAVTW